MSANPYLLNLIREEFPDITVRKMPDSRTDVANGLACIALDYGIIQQRRSTKNYGLVSQYEWERGMPSLEKLGGGIHEHTGEAQFPAVEWIIRKVSKQIPSPVSSLWKELRLTMFALLPIESSGRSDLNVYTLQNGSMGRVFRLDYQT